MHVAQRVTYDVTYGVVRIVLGRDWFQLTLKEGLTVFRDQLFSGDMGSHAAKRIEVRLCSFVGGPGGGERGRLVLHPGSMLHSTQIHFGAHSEVLFGLLLLGGRRGRGRGGGGLCRTSMCLFHLRSW